MTTGTLACPFFRILEKKKKNLFFLEFVFLSTIYPSKENKGAFFHRFKPDEKIELLNFRAWSKKRLYAALRRLEFCKMKHYF